MTDEKTKQILKLTGAVEEMEKWFNNFPRDTAMQAAFLIRIREIDAELEALRGSPRS